MLIKIKSALVFFICCYFSNFNSYAQPVLEFPVDCTEGEDCWVVNYVDVEPTSTQVKDFNCGPRSYDNHKGTDIAIRDWQAMRIGVDVLAAADGKVLRLRDGVEDKVLSRVQLDNLKQENKSCGNGVFIEHENGWKTIYCHLKQNSIVVKPNQIVKAGQKLGEVGHSGYVEFPHLHLGVMHNDELIDPYTGLSHLERCNNPSQKQRSVESLWQDKKYAHYNPVSLYAAGFSNKISKFERIKQDASSAEELSVDSPVLTFWVAIFGVQKEDKVHMEIRDPKGSVFVEKEIIQEKTRARQFLYIGKKNRSNSLIKGKYVGVVTFRRQLINGETEERTLHKSLMIN